MRNISCRVISFKQYPEAPEHLYALNDRELKMGDYVYMREMGRFAAIQRVLHKYQLKNKFPVVEASTNENYELPRIPPVFVEAYFKSDKTLKTIQLRLP